MDVIGISSDKSVYNPDDNINLNIVVQWGLFDTGGVIILGERAEGESAWRTITSQTVGNPGIGLPNIGMAGKDQTLSISIAAPEIAGYYQIGAREQGQQDVPASGGLEIQIVPTTPTAESNEGIVQVKTNQSDPGDTVLYVDGNGVATLPAAGYYLTLTAGSHSISASGSQYSASPVNVTVYAGSNQTILLPLQAGGATGDQILPIVGAVAAGAIAGLVILYFVNRGGEE